MSEITDFPLEACILRLSAQELIERLDREIPHRCVGYAETIEAAQRRAGARDLIDNLLLVLEDATKSSD